jgi:hypothetical protein
VAHNFRYWIEDRGAWFANFGILNLNLLEKIGKFCRIFSEIGAP